jgi:DNA polymerase-3 subunit gamma/tau
VSVNDLYEIDAASNRGIEDIKLLREGVRVSPFDSKYKVYIIDEVHMLSKDAWGALLKTLEEPPKHVIFILATTELHKVPETIISRCQVFTFKKPTEKILKKVLENVAKKEGYELETGSAELLALLADGSFRDALGELQKVLNFSKEKKIETADVEKITGAPKTTLVNDFISAIAEKDLPKGMAVVQKASEANLDMKLYFNLILQKFRLAIILRYTPKLLNDPSTGSTSSLQASSEQAGDLSETDLEFLQNLIKIDTDGMLRSSALAILLEAYQNIDNSFVAELPLELALIKIINKE